VILFRQVHRTVIEQVRIRVVSVDEQNFGNVSASRPAFDMDYEVERIGYVRLDRSVRQLHAALQNTTREARETLLRGICVDGAETPGVTGVKELQEVESLSASDLTQDQSVRAVAKGCFQEIADGHCRKAILFAAGFKADEVFLRQLKLGRIFDNEDPLVLRNEFSKDGK
jgi:hypothetical protein